MRNHKFKILKPQPSLSADKNAPYLTRNTMDLVLQVRVYQKIRSQTGGSIGGLNFVFYIYINGRSEII